MTYLFSIYRGCLISCRAAIFAATSDGRYRNLPYIWGLGVGL